MANLSPLLSRVHWPAMERGAWSGQPVGRAKPLPAAEGHFGPIRRRCTPLVPTAGRPAPLCLCVCVVHPSRHPRCCCWNALQRAPDGISGKRLPLHCRRAGVLRRLRVPSRPFTSPRRRHDRDMRARGTSSFHEVGVVAAMVVFRHPKFMIVDSVPWLVLWACFDKCVRRGQRFAIESRSPLSARVLKRVRDASAGIEKSGSSSLCWLLLVAEFPPLPR